MNPQELIAAAYAADIGEREREAVFMELVASAERSYNDQDARLQMRSEDLSRTFSL